MSSDELDWLGWLGLAAGVVFEQSQAAAELGFRVDQRGNVTRDNGAESSWDELGRALLARQVEPAEVELGEVEIIEAQPTGGRADR